MCMIVVSPITQGRQSEHCQSRSSSISVLRKNSYVVVLRIVTAMQESGISSCWTLPLSHFSVLQSINLVAYLTMENCVFAPSLRLETTPEIPGLSRGGRLFWVPSSILVAMERCPSHCPARRCPEDRRSGSRRYNKTYNKFWQKSTFSAIRGKFDLP